MAYLIQIAASFVYLRVNRMVGLLIVALSMFAPTCGVLLSGAKLKDMGWKPQFKKNIKTILFAWFMPAVLTAVGAALYFLVFPSHFDLSGAYVTVSAGEEAIRQLEEQGLTYSVMILITVVNCVTYAPFINTFTGIGEEIGWRGFLYPQLKARFGKRIGWLLGGAIWGAWHWPLIWLIGYEYGVAAGNEAGYFGFPVVGMLLFCVITVILGILHDRVYEKSGTIWLPALFHGAVNAAFGVPLAVCRINTGSARLLGPSWVGALSCLPFAVPALILWWKAGRKGAREASTNLSSEKREPN